MTETLKSVSAHNLQVFNQLNCWKFGKNYTNQS